MRHPENQKGDEGSIKMFLLGKFKISGHSMEPAIENGQEILVSSLPFLFSKPKTGDMIAFSFARPGLTKLAVKRIKKINGNKYLIEGDNKSDSKKFGWIERKNIIGKVVYIFK